MIFLVDADYRESKAVATGVLFQNWEDGEPVDELIAPISAVANVHCMQRFVFKHASSFACQAANAR